MSELRFETLELPAARLGPPNPLAPLVLPRNMMADVVVGASVPAGARARLGYGCEAACLPYPALDDYDRRREPRPFRVAVLESAHLRATFLLELGGRLASLVDLRNGRELLARNPVFQPANLAVRNAWFSGGIEWNVGVPGHTPLGCDPPFAARARGPGGEPALRLWELERIRGAVFQLDCWLPDDLPFLLCRVRLCNPNAVEVPMYWWTNIAVPERDDVRVLAPARSAYHFGYAQHMERVPLPRCGGIDVTRPTQLADASDYFYEVPDGERPWIAALDGGGRGLVETSTARLRGRKLFVWGMGAGGRRWQEFLSVPGEAYLEIQAGLARTQYECLPMPAGAEWTWVEAFGPLEADPARVHGDLDGATAEVARRLDAALPPGRLEAGLVLPAEAEPVQLGSGWGALEARRRAHAGEPPLPVDFPAESLGPEQAPWLALLERGALPDAPAAGFVAGPAWRALLERAPPTPAALDHLGVVRFAAGDLAGAREAWQRAGSLRNLGALARLEGRAAEAADLYAAARARDPALGPLAVEWAAAQLDAGRAAEVLAAPLPRSGRLQVLEARAALAVGDLGRAAAILEGPLEVPDLREGELVLSDLWYELEARRSGVPADEVRRTRRPPPHLDFRMAGTK